MQFEQIVIIWLFIEAFRLLTWLLWRSVNFLADQILRRNGWDSEEEWTPMDDYIPAWRLIIGTGDMGNRTMRKRI